MIQVLLFLRFALLKAVRSSFDDLKFKIFQGYSLFSSYEQFEKGEVIPARIVNHFEEADEQKEIADIFQTTFKVNMNSDEKERALNELVFKIKEYSIDKKLKNLTDITKLQSLMIEKNKIQNRDKMHISLKDG